jgi:muramidase (phage lysozyme)
MNERQLLEKYRENAAGQNLLRTLRFAEGTERGGLDSYRVMFGGRLAPNLKTHPGKVVRSGKYASDASGAYQFLSPSWQSHAKALGLKDFSPINQDLAALRAARNRLMPIGGLAALEKEGFSPRVSAALAPEWASLPTETGESYYGQPVKKLSQLQKVFGQTPFTPAPPSTETAGAVQKGNQQAGSLLQSIMKYIPMAGAFPGLSSLSTPEQISLPDSQDFLNAYKMFFNEEEDLV